MDSSTSMSDEKIFPFSFISSFVSFDVCIYVRYLFDAVRKETSNKKYLFELIKRSPNFYRNCTSLEQALNYNQRNTFFENYKNYKNESFLFIKEANKY